MGRKTTTSTMTTATTTTTTNRPTLRQREARPLAVALKAKQARLALARLAWLLFNLQ
jgi:hypothetical protein